MRWKTRNPRLGRLTAIGTVGRTGALDGDIAQLGERVNGIHEVRGSIPLISTR